MAQKPVARPRKTQRWIWGCGGGVGWGGLCNSGVGGSVKSGVGRGEAGKAHAGEAMGCLNMVGESGGRQWGQVNLHAGKPMP